jgi:D-alanyl-D-alanine carboxypeptidase
MPARTSRLAALLASRALWAATISAAGTATSATNLEPIDATALQAVVESVGRELLVPGAMVLLRTPEGDFVHGYGTTELGGRTAPAGDTHFRIASNTKTMTAAVTVLLAQEGKLRLDDPVSKYVPGVPNGDGITVSDLLSMRSGLPEITDAPEFMAILDGDPGRAWTPQELLAIAFERPPVFAPGAEFRYCNTNYLLLGLIIEQVEDAPLARVFQDRLFEPLGMKDTQLPAAASTAIPEPYAHGYMFGASSYAMTDAPYPADLQAAARAGSLQPADYTNQNPSYATAAGGVISTADDLAVWMRALVGGEVLDAEFQRQWLDSLVAEDPDAPGGQKYGYGISAIAFGPNRLYFHGGEMPGYNSFMGHDPVNDVTLVVWSNLTLSLDGQHTANSIMLRILGEIYADSPLHPNR